MRNESKVVAAMAMLSLLAALPAQDELTPAQRAVEVKQQIVELLTGFGRKATVNRQYSRAERAYRMVLEHYDADNVAAHKGLGHRKVKGEWREASKRKRRPDDTTRRKQTAVEKAWRDVAGKIGQLHGELGLVLVDAGEEAEGHQHLERALTFQPDEAKWHRALGHQEIDGFFGTDVQVAFATRMQEIREKANELREKTYEVKELDASKMPSTLKRLGIEFKGAKSKHFTHWVAGAQTEANDSLQWAERCYDLLSFVLGRHRHSLNASACRWYVILQDGSQRDLMFEKSPESTGRHTPDQARMFAGSTFRTDGGMMHATWGHYDTREDAVVAHVAKVHLLNGRNTALGEGLMHVCQYLICGTTLTYYASLPHTVTADYVFMKREPGVWRERIEEEVAAGKDWQLSQLPRERSDNFRDSARIKAWSFMGWMMARYPKTWWKLITTMGPNKDLTPELAAERYEQALGRTVDELQAEWREWAKAGSKLYDVSGF